MKKAKKITYLFGAGASYNAVPILNSLSKSMRSVAHDLAIESLNYENVKIFQRKLIELANISEEYGTVDTYAKKLFLNGEVKELKEMKFLLSIFFAIWQGYYYKIEFPLSAGDLLANVEKKKSYDHLDYRYKTLLSNYLEVDNRSFSIKLDENINFLTWNYDSQIELAFQLFNNDKCELIDINKYFQFLPTSNDNSKNRIIHLNGISNIINNSGILNNLFESSDFISKTMMILKINRVFEASFMSANKALIDYSWDDNDEIVDAAIKIIKQTDILIIIGYSFPTFNRAIDSQLLSGSGNSFDKIIYQDPNASEELLELFHINLRNKSKDVNGKYVNYKILKEKGQFYIPPEYFPQGEEQSKYNV